MEDDSKKITAEKIEAAKKDGKELLKAIEIVQAEICRCREEYEEIARTEEGDPVMLEGMTTTRHDCHLLVDPKIVAKVFLKYDYPVWNTLGDDAPTAMWDELADIFGLGDVYHVDL